MAENCTDSAAATLSGSKASRSISISSDLYRGSELLYNELGITLSAAASIFLLGTIGVGSLPFQPTPKCVSFLKERAHLDLLRAVQAENSFSSRPSHSNTGKNHFSDELDAANHLWDKRDKRTALSLAPQQIEEAQGIFDKMGLSLPDAITLFLQQSLDSQGLPFQPTKDLPMRMRNDSIKRLRKELKCGLESPLEEDISGFYTQMRKEDLESIIAPFQGTASERKCIRRLIMALEGTPELHYTDRGQSSIPQKKDLPERNTYLCSLKFGVYDFVQYDTTRYPHLTRVRLIDGREPWMLICVPWLQRQEEISHAIEEHIAYKNEQTVQRRRRHKIV